MKNPEKKFKKSHDFQKLKLLITVMMAIRHVISVGVFG